jgi:hypothetical protein
MPARKVQDGKVRYAVVGAGWISQAAVMPAFAQTGNSELVALVTEDPKKGEILRQRYGLAHVYSYDHYHELLRSDVVDAIYMGLPNWMHHDYTVPALEAGLHVLLEKPMAVSEAECRAIEEAAEAAGVRLMIGYRLHFEPARSVTPASSPPSFANMSRPQTTAPRMGSGQDPSPIWGRTRSTLRATCSAPSRSR